MITFTNPLGFIALLGIPLVLLIHFFQLRSRPVYVSTLFLLDRGRRESIQGSRLDRLVKSIPMWMQLLLVLLLTLLLVQPVVVQKMLTQRVAVVVDSSASMRVFKEAARDKLEDVLAAYSERTEHLELFLIDSDAYGSPLYHGDSIDKLLQSLKDWNPVNVTHSPVYSIKMARSLVGVDGEVVYITDTMPEKTVAESHVFSVGEDIANCGFTGIQFQNEGEQVYWQASVRNYNSFEQERSWTLFADGKKLTEPKVMQLGAKKVLTLRGRFPDGARTCELRLDQDRFSLDDSLPFVRPEEKMIKLQSARRNRNLLEKLIKSFDGVEGAKEGSDVDIWEVSIRELDQVNGACIASVPASTENTMYHKGVIVAEPHALMDGLNWQSLLVRECSNVDLLEGDTVLLWQGKKPLILLRQKKAPQLIFNFEISNSNAFKQEAFVVLLWRYIEGIRSQTPAYHSGMVDLGQELRVALNEGEIPIHIEAIDSNGGGAVEGGGEIGGSVLHAPMVPGFFQIKQGSFLHFLGAASFADIREADFTACSTQERLAVLSATAGLQQSESEGMWRYVLLLCFVALGVSWYQKRKQP